MNCIYTVFGKEFETYVALTDFLTKLYSVRADKTALTEFLKNEGITEDTSDSIDVLKDELAYIFSSISPQEEVLQKLESGIVRRANRSRYDNFIRPKTAEEAFKLIELGLDTIDNSKETGLDLTHSIGLTKALEQFTKSNGGPIITAFDFEAWKANVIISLKTTITPEQKELIKSVLKLNIDVPDKVLYNTLFENEVALWSKEAEIGNYVHSLFEKVIHLKRTKDKNGKIKGTRLGDVFKNNKLTLNDNDITYIATEVWNKSKEEGESVFENIEQLKSFIKTDVSEFFKELSKTNDEDTILLSEIIIQSSKLSESAKTLMGNDNDSINGRIDLMIVSPKGDVKVMDFKISKKYTGSWALTDNQKIRADQYSSAKKQHINYQLDSYKAMLRQFGFSVKGSFVVPIHLQGNDTKDTQLYYINENGEEKGYFRIVNKDDYKVKRVGLQHIRTGGSNTKNLEPEIVNTLTLSSTKNDLLDYFPQKVDIPLNSTERTNTVISKLFSPKLVIRTQHTEIVQDTIEEWKSKNQSTLSYWKKSNPNWTEERIDREVTIKINQNDNRSRSLFSTIHELFEQVSEGTSANIFERNQSVDNISYLRYYLQPYLTGRYELVSDVGLGELGIIIVKNKDTDVLDFFYLSDNDATEIVPLQNGIKNISGLEQFNVNIEHDLTSNYGHIGMATMMIYVKENISAFKGFKIGSFNYVNITGQNGSTVPTKILYENISKAYENYHTKHKDDNLYLPNFENMLVVPAVSYAQRITDILSIRPLFRADQLKILDNAVKDGVSPFDVLNANTFNNLVVGEKKLKLLELKRYIEYNYKVSHTGRQSGLKESLNINDPIHRIYIYITIALAEIDNHFIPIDLDPVRYMGLNKETVFEFGTSIVSPQLSNSVPLRLAGRLVAAMNDNTTKRYNDIRPEIDKYVQDFYDQFGGNRGIGYAVTAETYDRFYRTTSDGKIDPQFLLKDPETANELTDVERTFLRYFLNRVNTLRYGKNWKNKVLDGLSIYHLPLAPMSETTARQKTGISGYFKRQYDKSVNALSLFGTQLTEVSKEKGEQLTFFNKFKIGINPFNRKQILESYGSELETNLEVLLREMEFTYIKEEETNKILPELMGLKATLEYNKTLYGQRIENNYQELTNYIARVIEGLPTMDEKLLDVNKIVSIGREIVSTVTLGFNTTSVLREFFTGYWVAASKVMGKMYGKNMFSMMEFNQAFKIVLGDTKNRVSNYSKLDNLNFEYRIVNYDIAQQVAKTTLSKKGIRRFSSDKLYVLNSLPDFQHRMSVLVAKMLHDGCWDAHEMVTDENGVSRLIYDFTKDERYSALVANDKSDLQLYNQQLAIYIQRKKELIRQGLMEYSSDKEIIPLRYAYSATETQSLKTFSDICFGHYDEDGKMALKSAFLGAMILQFKTFISSKVEQWTITPGKANMGEFGIAMNDEGIKYVKYVNNEGELTMALETELPSGITDWEYAQEWKGLPMEGIAYTVFSFMKSIIKMDFEQMKKLWASPTKRANLLFMLWDLLAMYLAYMMFSLLFGINPQSRSENTLAENLLIYPFVTSFRNASPVDILSANTFTPAMYTSIQNTCTNIYSGLTGSPEKFLKITGMTAPFAY